MLHWQNHNCYEGRKIYTDSCTLIQIQTFWSQLLTNTKVIGEERIKLEELLNLMNGYKAIGEIKNPIKFEEDSFNNAKTALDDWLKKILINILIIIRNSNDSKKNIKSI